MLRAKEKYPVLVAGFEPFAGDAVNPSQEIARALHGMTIRGHPVVGTTLPCVFATSHRVLARALREFRPGLVIGLGLASGRTAITPERVAINLDDARIPDNSGTQPVDRPIVRGGPAAYWSTLPVKAIVAALQSKNIPASVSHSAGTFVCNHAFYHLMHILRNFAKVRGGFIHVPAMQPAVSGAIPMLPIETQIAGIRLAIEVCLRRRGGDLSVKGGEIS